MAAGVVDIDIITPDIAPELTASIDEVLEQDLSPDIKTKLLIILLIGIGSHFKKKLFGDASKIVASDIDGGMLTDDENDQTERLVLKLQRNYALNRGTTSRLVESYLFSLLDSAKAESFANAKSLGKHPTLTRKVVSETCSWCNDKAGTYTNPTSKDFARHTDCDCLLIVSGYNTRNGTVSNYVKRKDKS